MSEEERFGTRPLIYSAWHRTGRIERYLNGRGVQLGMIDLDDVEYCRRCYKPLALIEVARDLGQQKVYRVTRELGRLAGLPVALAFYTPTTDGDDITAFRVRQALQGEIAMTPQEYADWLWTFHAEHKCWERKDTQ